MTHIEFLQTMKCRKRLSHISAYSSSKGRSPWKDNGRFRLITSTT